MKKNLLSYIKLTLLIIFFPSLHLLGQSESQKLSDTILRLDSAFWDAYNNCDTTRFLKFFSDDVEFYHDEGGVTKGLNLLVESLRKSVCEVSDYRVRRAAVEGTVKVYPMRTGDQVYGAIISGEHKFYYTRKDQPEHLVSIGNFTHLWELKDSVWKMKRIFSYNHHLPPYTNTRKAINIPLSVLDRYDGSYKSDQAGSIIIVRAGKLLEAKSNGEVYTLYPLTQTSFFAKDGDIVLEFEVRDNGKPVELKLRVNGDIVGEFIFQN